MTAETDQIGYARRAAFYRVEYDEKRDIPFFLSFIEQDQTTVLEIPCGAGRLTAELAKKAKHVTAIDIEPLMKSSLEQYIGDAGLTHKVTALLGDMTVLGLNRTFDVIIVPSEALQLLPRAEGRKAFKCLVDHLNQHGQLIIDIATFNEQQSGTPNYFDPKTIGREWHRQWTRELPGNEKLTRSVRIKATPELRRFEFLYHIEKNDQETISFSDVMDLYLYDMGWFFDEAPDNVGSIKVMSSYDESSGMCAPARYILVIKKKLLEPRA